MMKIISPDEFKKAVQKIIDSGWVRDPESGHADYDALCTEVLISLGYGEGVAIADTQVMWYA